MTTATNKATLYQLWKVDGPNQDDTYSIHFNYTKVESSFSSERRSYTQLLLKLTRTEILDLQETLQAALEDSEPEKGYVAHELPDGTWACSWAGMWLPGVYGASAVEAIERGRAEVAKG